MNLLHILEFNSVSFPEKKTVVSGLNSEQLEPTSTVELLLSLHLTAILELRETLWLLALLIRVFHTDLQIDITNRTNL